MKSRVVWLSIRVAVITVSSALSLIRILSLRSGDVPAGGAVVGDAAGDGLAAAAAGAVDAAGEAAGAAGFGAPGAAGAAGLGDAVGLAGAVVGAGWVASRPPQATMKTTARLSTIICLQGPAICLPPCP